jgi:hypothetical protein
MSPEEQLKEFLSGMDPDVADRALLSYIYVRVAEIGADTEILLAIMGALCARVGFSLDEMAAITKRVAGR